jgi:hypothetical protein
MSSSQEVSYAVPNSAFKFEIIVCVPGAYTPATMRPKQDRSDLGVPDQSLHVMWNQLQPVYCLALVRLAARGAAEDESSAF